MHGKNTTYCFLVRPERNNTGNHICGPSSTDSNLAIFVAFISSIVSETLGMVCESERCFPQGETLQGSPKSSWCLILSIFIVLPDIYKKCCRFINPGEEYPITLVDSDSPNFGSS